MSILWLTWKDIHHPAAGGAELVAHELCLRLLRDGHRVTMLTSSYPGAVAEEISGRLHIIRVGGNRYTHPVQALAYYMRNLRGQYDYLIEEVNGGAPYFSVPFAKRERAIMLYHQLARVNWLYEIKRPFSYLGYYCLVPLATRLASLARTPVITVSESTRQALTHHGFDQERIYLISEGIDVTPVAELGSIRKFARPTLLSFGAMRAMKRTLDHIRAFEKAKRTIPDLQLKIAGNAGTPYGRRVLARIERSPHHDSIEYMGPVSKSEKIRLLQRSHLILQTAIEEGWGLTVTEAASQGTPAVAYDVAGLRDSVRHGETGLITAALPDALAGGINTLLTQKDLYEKMRQKAWQWSKQITFDQSYRDFLRILEMP